MYGLPTEEIAKQASERLWAEFPNRKYVVEPYAKRCQTMDKYIRQGHKPPILESWGVVEFVPYCEAMPMRCLGFVWFRNDKGEV